VIRQISLFDKPVDLLTLAICQRIHRIDYDCAGAGWFAGCACTDCCIDDWDEEAKRLSRPGACRNNKTLASRCLCDGLRLMSIERERFAISAENPRGRLVQGAGFGELIDGHAAFKPRIDAYERLGPKSIAGIDFFDLDTDVRRPNPRE
jgi:hypothetical protein